MSLKKLSQNVNFCIAKRHRQTWVPYYVHVEKPLNDLLINFQTELNMNTHMNENCNDYLLYSVDGWERNNEEKRTDAELEQ